MDGFLDAAFTPPPRVFAPPTTTPTKPAFVGTVNHALTAAPGQTATTAPSGAYMVPFIFRTPSAPIGIPAGFTDRAWQLGQNGAYNARIVDRFTLAANETYTQGSPNGTGPICWWSGVDASVTPIVAMAAGLSTSAAIPSLSLGPGSWLVLTFLYAESGVAVNWPVGITARGLMISTTRRQQTGETSSLVSTWPGAAVPLGSTAMQWITGAMAIKGVPA